VEKVGGEHYVYALLHRHALGELGLAQPNLHVRRPSQRLQELLLALGALGPLAGFLEDVVVVDARQPALSYQLLGELAEVQVNAVEAVPQGMVEVASVYEYGYSFVRNRGTFRS
jgi:hypothetical protein